jgi:hypothetical protein
VVDISAPVMPDSFRLILDPGYFLGDGARRF